MQLCERCFLTDANVAIVTIDRCNLLPPLGLVQRDGCRILASIDVSTKDVFLRLARWSANSCSLSETTSSSDACTTWQPTKSALTSAKCAHRRLAAIALGRSPM